MIPGAKDGILRNFGVVSTTKKVFTIVTLLLTRILSNHEPPLSPPAEES